MSTSPLTIDISYLHKVNYAIQHNGIPFIHSCLLHHEGEQDYTQVLIRLSLHEELCESCELRLERVSAGSYVALPDLQLKLSASYLSQLTESVKTQMRLSIQAGEDLLSESFYPVEILPFDQWGGVRQHPEMLAAFCTPNHPAINRILRRAASVLEEWTGDASFDAYQSHSSDRVRKQMAAIFQALGEEEIIYCTSPASYEKTGQRIRLADNCLSQKLGNCLDMSLLFASCLEAVGINSLLVITHGHAFAGAWLVDEMFNDCVNDDISALTKRLAAGINDIAVAECTLLNASKTAPFDAACRVAEDALLREEDFVCSLDMKRCRLSSIKPLPQRVLGDEGAITLEEAPQSPLIQASPYSINPHAELMTLEAGLATKQKVWERKLLDLSLRNNLLNARISRSTVQLMANNLNVWEDKLAEGESFVILPKPQEWTTKQAERESTRDLFSMMAQTDPVMALLDEQLRQNRLHSYLSDAELDKCLTYLYRQARLSLEENGANTLYLALGMLRWYETERSERARFAPLLLMPVEITRKSSRRGYTIRALDEQTMVNITLLEMLKQDFGINISSLAELPRDVSGVDVELIFNSLRKVIMGQPRWDVEQKALLGIFSFSKFIMWNDIHQHAEVLTQNPIVEALTTASYEGAELPQQWDKVMPLPISADSCQREAIALASEGHSFVLHGPPGSGKSQTITNMIARALYQGKRVLFVAEKMAALTVVQSRLQKIGLAPFCMELHSNKSTKSAVLKQLQEAIDFKFSACPQHFQRESERLAALRDKLALPIDRLHHRYPLGLSLYDALSQWQEEEQPYILSGDIACQISEEDWESMQSQLKELQQSAVLCGTVADHPLKLIGLSQFSPKRQKELQELLTQLCQVGQQLEKDLAALSSILPTVEAEKLTFTQLEQLCQLAEKLHSAKEELPPLSLLRVESLPELSEQFTILLPHGQRRDSMKKQLLNTCKESMLTLPAVEQKERWQSNSEKWFLPRFFALRKQRKELGTHMRMGGIDASAVPDLLDVIIAYQEKQELVEAYVPYFTHALGAALGSLPESCWSDIEKALQQASELSALLLPLCPSIADVAAQRHALAEQLSEGVDAFLSLHGKALSQLLNQWQQYQQLENQLAEQASMHIRLTDAGTLRDWINQYGQMLPALPQLRDWALWNSSCAQVQHPALMSYVEHLTEEETRLEQISTRFTNALLRNLIDNCIEKESCLAQFRGQLFEDSIEQFRRLSKQHEELTRGEIINALASHLPDAQARSSQQSELGILLRAIKSRGRGLSIRQLFDQIPDLLPRLKPCMLMSPLSVAQFIALDEQPYDLIIFDEASQMPTSEAVGAIARGKNVVIVGDPKQMPPTSFFSTNTVDEDNICLEDLESILDDCLALAMPSRYLRWHYRSKHESLIAFSNHQYYDNKLLTYPSPDNLSQKVTWQHVEGYYDKGKTRQNPAEADAIVAEVMRRLRDPQLRHRSIGIVTFSQVQQSLIEDKLQELLCLPENRELEQIAFESEENLFVKNLENVQGDERDVILFSVTYGPDKQGKVSLNFGPLNREGGQRRLNVAVSRARYEMIIFSTLQPEHIDLARSSAEGVAGLKRFLEFAQKGSSILAQSRDTVAKQKHQLIEHIAEQLRHMGGYQVDTQVGCSGYRIDLAIHHPDREGQYLAAILCDGEQYAQCDSINDRENTQPSVLAALGWNILRFWVLDWMYQPERSLQALIEQLEQVRQQSSQPEPEPQSEPEPPRVEAAAPVIAPMLIPEQEAKKSDYEIAYESAALEPLGVEQEGEDLSSPQHRAVLVRQLAQILESEAPIHEEYLVRLILKHWGVTRMTKKVKDYILQVLADMQVSCRVQSDGHRIFWKSERQAEEYRGYRIAPHGNVEYIPLLELAVLARSLVEQQISLPRKELQREMAYKLGYNKLGKNILICTEAGIAKSEEMQLLVQDGERMRLTE